MENNMEELGTSARIVAADSKTKRLLKEILIQ
jgi:hypothetical protein